MRQGKPTGKITKLPEGLYSDADSSDNPSPQKTGARSRSRSSSATPSATAPASVDPDVASGVEGELHVKLALMGGVLSPLLPVTGTTVIMRSEMASHAIVEVLKDHPKRFKQLQKLLAASKYADLTLACSSLLVAVMLDMRILSPQSMPAQYTIPDVLAKFQEQAERQQTAGDTAGSNGQTPHEPAQSSSLFDSPAAMTEEDAIAAGFYHPPHSNGGSGE